MEGRTVHCGRHGENREAFMSKHLLEQSGLGVFTDCEEPDNPYPDAWCPACEQARIQGDEGGIFASDYYRAKLRAGMRGMLQGDQSEKYRPHLRRSS